MLYLILKWLHILAAITALGANITYSIWRSRALRDPQNLGFVLRTIRFIDMRLVNPAYLVLLALGLIMVYLGHWSITSPWLVAGIALYVLVFLLGFLVIAPVSRRQVALVEASQPGPQEYQSVARRANLTGAVLVAVVVAIVFFMVVKPALWGG